MANDEISLKAQLKQLKMEEKKRKREAKLEKKMARKEAKKAKREAALKVKLAAGKISLPPEPAKKPSAADEPPEAEIIMTAKEFTPKSSKSIDEKRARIDRLSAEGVKSLKSRFREKYGEEMEVPDVYEKSYDLSLGEPSTGPELPGSVSEPDAEIKIDEMAEKKGFGRKGAKRRPTGPRPLRFFDLRHPLYFKNKFTDKESRGVKKAIMIIIDIFMYLIIPIFILRIITTILYVIKDSRAAKREAAASAQSGQQVSEASS